jgi:acyl-CoA synthetase (AMP-forming)/AMP-acid ligase II
VVLMSRFDADELVGHIALHRATLLALEPLMLSRLAAHPDFEDADLSSLRWVASVGSPARMPARIAFAARNLTVRLLLPLAQAGPNLFDGDCAAGEDLQLGKPLPDMLLSLRLGDGGTPLPGEAGELMASGAMVFNGYYQAPEATAPSLRDGVCRTGILARALPSGAYSLLGTADDAIRIGNRMVFPVEIEAALLRCEGVADCVVATLPDQQRETSLVAAIAMHEGAAPQYDALLAEYRNLNPDLPLPNHWFPLKVVPRNAWGAVNRFEVVQQFVQSKLR